MTHEELARRLQELDLSEETFANLLNFSSETGINFLDGTKKIPSYVEFFLDNYEKVQAFDAIGKTFETVKKWHQES